MKRKYMLALIRPYFPPVGNPIRIKSKGFFDYNYKLTDSNSKATKVSYLQGLFHMLLLVLSTSTRRKKMFNNQRIWGKLLLVKDSFQAL